MARSKLSLMIQFYDFLKVRKKYWLVPIILSFFLLAMLTVMAQGSAVAPFIYTLF